MQRIDLLETDAFIAQLLGSVEQHKGYRVVRTPDNPGFYFGNFLILEEAPTDLHAWLRTFEDSYEPAIGHRCFSWAGEPLDEGSRAAAQELQLLEDASVEMQLTRAGLAEAVAHGPDPPWTIRPLELTRDWPASESLAIACDASIADASESYRLFAERVREARRKWLERDLATWWGVFAGDELVAQCGMVVCQEVGRYQAVETHPAWRRRGICRALISRVAMDAFGRLGLDRLLLAAEVDGPALGLYSRIGFRETGRTHSLLRHPNPMHVRGETLGDQAGVRSLVCAAFGGQQEALLIEGLRTSTGSISLIAEQSNTILGQVLFSKLQIRGQGPVRSAVALAPLAVRPAAQGRGVGSLLVREGLERCRSAGHELCVVIGSPAYYGRFGFQPAAPHGLRNPFGVEDDHFLVHELTPGALAGCTGDLIYDPSFDALGR